MADGGDLSVGQRVRVNAVGGHERAGVIVEDFGDAPGCAVTVGDVRIAEPSRRWAVQLDDGNLVFADSVDLEDVG
ncbi:MAG: hypothetical protein WBV80_25255 [Mycobacterium sp.]